MNMLLIGQDQCNVMKARTLQVNNKILLIFLLTRGSPMKGALYRNLHR